MPTRYGDTPATLIDDIGHAIAEQYRRIEDILVKKLQDAISQHLDHKTDDLAAQLATIQDLRQQAEALVGKIPPQQVAEWVVQTAGDAASATITRQLLKYPRLAGNLAGINAGSAYSLAAIAVELRDTLRHVNARILRAPADIYQQMTASNIGELLAGITTHQQLQKQIRDKYLAQGITGFTDKGGRRWTIGAYTEMATRTAAARAWRDQALTSMQSAGITTYQVITGASTCTPCAQWTGKVLTTGTPGMQMVEHAETGELTPFRVDATVDEWRGSGAGHPNCRCVLVMAAPGMPDYSEHTTQDPEREQQHRKLRELERRVRAAKRTGDKDAIGEAQAELRSFQRGTGIARRNYREQLPFADGGTVNPRGRTKPTPPYKGSGTGARPPRKPTIPGPPYKSRTDGVIKKSFNLNGKTFPPLQKQDVMVHRNGMVAKYGSIKHLSEYTQAGGDRVNAFLNGVPVANPGACRKAARAIDRDMAISPLKRDLTTYRVVSDSILETFAVDSFADLEGSVGKELHWKGFTSTGTRDSSAIERAMRYDPQVVFLTIRVPAGVQAIPLAGISAAPGESELLLERGLKVQVREMKVLDGGYAEGIVDVIGVEKWAI